MRRHSIKISMILILLPLILIAMVILSLLGYTSAKHIIQDSVGSEMELSLSTAVEDIEKSLMNNGKVAETMARAVEAGRDKFEDGDYGNLLTSFIETNDETFGGGIWFEPYAYQPGQQYFSPYCMRENGQVVYVDDYSLGDGVFYTDQDWYTSAKNISEPIVWSAPYYDDYAKISMVTSTAPFYNEAGRLLGVTTTDIDLTQLQKMVESLHVHTTGRAFLIDGTGTYIADEDSEKLLQVNILEDGNPSLAALGKEILSNRSGTGSYQVNGTNYLAWYDVVPESGWIIVTAIAERDLMGGVNALARNLLITCIVAALVLGVLLILFLDFKLVRPLSKLANATSAIADGDLDVSIDYHSKNEIGTVCLSLERTVERLRNYIAYIDEVSSVLSQVAQGNLDFQLKHEYTGEFGKLKAALLQIQSTLVATIQDIVQVSGRVSDRSREISEGTHSLSEGALSQSAAVEGISRNIEEMQTLVNTTSESLQSVSEHGDRIMEAVTQDNARMQDMTAAMKKINNTSTKISKIIQAVENIAFQTNILALNAAVEAARAGTAGKGFAVVADEVRNLANKSSEASKSTSELIGESMRAVQQGMVIADETAAAMGHVVTEMSETTKILSDVAVHSGEQVRFIQSISREVEQVSGVVSNNSAMSQETAAKCAELFQESVALQNAAGRFHVKASGEQAGMGQSQSYPENG